MTGRACLKQGESQAGIAHSEGKRLIDASLPATVLPVNRYSYSNATIYIRANEGLDAPVRPFFDKPVLSAVEGLRTN